LIEDDVYYLTDAGSTNGTYANGERVSQYPLRDGDRIQLGAASVLRFTYQVEPAEESSRARYEAALRDPSTGLFNRGYLRNRLESDVASALRHGKPLSLIVFAIDQLTTLATAQGERVADALVRALARHVREITRCDDVLARWSDDGFALVCREVDAMRAARAAARICQTVAARAFTLETDDAPRVTLSLGVADLGLLRQPTAEALVEAADTALFVAQRNGQNRVEIYDPEHEPTRHV
jgi:diguanylate cyclase (GGDEF)-like protein